MTLKDKFKEVMNYQFYFGVHQSDKIERASENLEKVSEEFAIDFTEWKDENTLRVDLNGYKAFGDTENDKPHTLQQLLEIYKKEKGL